MSKEIGVLFTPFMVMGNLKKWKGETRRTTGLKKVNENPDDWVLHGMVKDEDKGRYIAVFHHKDTGLEYEVNCRYGLPGDIIKQRENFYAYGRWIYGFDKEKGRDAWRFVDEEAGYHYEDNPPDGIIMEKRVEGISGWYLRPSLYIPDVAVRCTYEVESIHCERLMDITPEAAVNEGIDRQARGNGFSFKDYSCKEESWLIGPKAPVVSFFTLWDTLHGEAARMKNPHLFVVKYKNE